MRTDDKLKRLLDELLRSRGEGSDNAIKSPCIVLNLLENTGWFLGDEVTALESLCLPLTKFHLSLMDQILARASCLRSPLHNLTPWNPRASLNSKPECHRSPLSRMIRAGWITDICGASGSGKSQVAMDLAASMLGSAAKDRVVYLDIGNNFNPWRFSTLTNGAFRSTKENLTIVQGCKTADDLRAGINRAFELSNASCLLVIDSISRVAMSGNEIAKFAAYLKSLVNWCILSLSGVVSKSNQISCQSKEWIDTKPATGHLWPHAVNVQMFLAPAIENDMLAREKVLIVDKHPSIARGESYKLVISSDGINWSGKS